nr:MAG TPA_asm: hypothetical protein [Bacteriophage sp.]
MYVLIILLFKIKVNSFFTTKKKRSNLGVGLGYIPKHAPQPGARALAKLKFSKPYSTLSYKSTKNILTKH